jgi:hypothetical protein
MAIKQLIAEYESGLSLPQIRDAIGKYESNDDYEAENPNSTASGRYQYIDSTWANYGGYFRAKDAPAEIQDRRMMNDLQWRWNHYGGDVEQIIAHHYYPALAGDKTKWNAPVPVQGGISLRVYVDGVLAKVR